MARAKNGFAIPKHWPVQDHAQYRPLAWFVPYDKNPRTHPKAQVDLLAKLLAEHGPDQPIVVDEDRIILKGHGRLLAATHAELGAFTFVQRRGLSAVDKEAMRISDNQVSLLSGWDQALIGGGIASLKAAGYEVELLGFSEVQLRGWEGANAPGADPEDTPVPPKKPIVRTGDIWELGGHRLMCGDSTKKENWKRLFGTDRAALIFTDPPYGVRYTSAAKPGGKFTSTIMNDEKTRDDLYKMLVAALKEMVAFTIEQAAFYIWHADRTREDFAQAMKAVGIVERQYLVWVKPSIITGHSDYQWQYEPCFYASRDDKAARFYGDRTESTVWHVQLATTKDTAVTIGNGVLLLDGAGAQLYVQNKTPKGKRLRQVRIAKDVDVYLTGDDHQQSNVWQVNRDPSYEHPTQKPVELARRAIENSSKPGEIVADGFLGSSSTLIACQMTGRRCYGMELDPVYCEVGIRRFARFVGSWDAVRLEGPDGSKTFEEVQAMRRGKTNRSVPSNKPRNPDSKVQDVPRTGT